MAEKEFVDSLLKTFKRGFSESVAIRPSDNFTLGVPDVLAWLKTAGRTESFAIEAKSLRPLMVDPFHRGRRIGMMLKHPFSGPQISMLRNLKMAGVSAFGLVRAATDTAFRVEPEDIPAKTGNFTHEELVKLGTPIRRENGLWVFWETIDGQVLSSRHRNHS